MLVANLSTASRLNQAVEDCLRVCHGSDHPFADLAAQIEHSKDEHELNEAELVDVERAVLSILRAMVGRD
jgi:hypothetical protein